MLINGHVYFKIPKGPQTRTDNEAIGYVDLELAKIFIINLGSFSI